MSPVAQAVLASWTMPPGLVVSLLVLGILYGRGFRRLHRQMPDRFPWWRLLAFLAGLALLLLAIASPLDAFAGLLLQVHMVQHLLLMLVAPPLLLLGAPALPLLRGLPGAFAKDGLGPFLAWPALRRIGDTLLHPVVCWLALVVTTWAWHWPAAYQLALRSPSWHAIEHGCFVGAALLFWWPVVQPWPSRPRWPRWAMAPYLLLADAQNSVFSALFVFSERLLYPFYANVPRLGGSTPLDDQVAAGAIMWVPAALFFLVPGTLVMLRALSPEHLVPTGAESATKLIPHPPFSWEEKGTDGRRRRFDLLAVPLIGPALRWPHGRHVAQGVLLLLALAVIADGVLGPQMSPMNLAGVLPWTYWRGLTVVALLAAGNLFCMACPFMLPRALARTLVHRLGMPHLQWPRRLRSKWLAVLLLVIFFWAYELFGLWDSPWWTAWIVVAYFTGALVIDGLFRGASFCKYVCPIGQFHFIQSLVSPLEVRVREPQACASCTTHDCLRGNQSHRGCELELFLPRKVGNLDCTFCLDCIHACPHDNIGILAVMPGSDLVHDPRRSSLRRLSRRPDVAALALVLVFAAFTSAAAMVAPVTVWQNDIAQRFGIAGTPVIMSAMLLFALVIAPALVAGLAALSSRAATGLTFSLRELICRFALALVPLGLTMWAAHLLFHLLSGCRSAVPVFQRIVTDLGQDWLGAPGWVPAAAVGTSANALLGLEILLLDAGLLLTLYVAWRIALRYTPRVRSALGLLTPWAAVAVALYLGGVWTFLQPMQMRGVMMH